ncbi:hypothetical protein Ctob_009431 [Chrysochromulina tobinii]|uniref:Uncharacterized protein n=1 Tax=Chrysochromulina tobinii TaxID=1460289 RepID=A0A0M0JNR3_9EUKA|nr:hypothetical protein Ctob_009431 [Chrysochromulina tobinii]|eukprot:KOO27898.1 hypothetical protein Ctob_009431 [Chrysochromulina sp. CCMP291]
MRLARVLRLLGVLDPHRDSQDASSTSAASVHRFSAYSIHPRLAKSASSQQAC